MKITVTPKKETKTRQDINFRKMVLFKVLKINIKETPRRFVILVVFCALLLLLNYVIRRQKMSSVSLQPFFPKCLIINVS